MMQRTIHRDTHRVVEQAGLNFDFVSPDTLESDPPLDIVDFSRKFYLDIKSRIDNVSEQLPVTSFVHEGSPRTDFGRAVYIEHDGHSSCKTDTALSRYQPFEQRVFGDQLDNVIDNNPVGPPNGTGGSRSNRSVIAMDDAKHFSNHFELPYMHSVFSDLSIHDKIISSPDTATSSSASLAGNPNGDAVSSASTPASSDYTSSRATQGDCARPQ